MDWDRSAAASYACIAVVVGAAAVVGEDAGVGAAGRVAAEHGAGS